MISSTSIEISSPSRGILLAPFEAAHLKYVLPVSMSLLAHQPAASAQYYCTADPYHLLESEMELPYGLTWGIFDAHNHTGSATPEAFMGTVTLYQDLVDGRLSETVQEVGTMLFHERFLGKGIGTLAKLAVANYAFSRNTHALRAVISPENIIAQKSLAKLGFSYLSTEEYSMRLVNERQLQLQNWGLLSNSALDAAETHPNFEQLSKGWQDYLDALQQVRIGEILNA